MLENAFELLPQNNIEIVAKVYVKNDVCVWGGVVCVHVCAYVCGICSCFCVFERTEGDAGCSDYHTLLNPFRQGLSLSWWLGYRPSTFCPPFSSFYSRGLQKHMELTASDMGVVDLTQVLVFAHQVLLPLNYLFSSSKHVSLVHCCEESYPIKFVLFFQI